MFYVFLSKSVKPALDFLQGLLGLGPIIAEGIADHFNILIKGGLPAVAVAPPPFCVVARVRTYVS